MLWKMALCMLRSLVSKHHKHRDPTAKTHRMQLAMHENVVPITSSVKLWKFIEISFKRL